MSFVRTVNIIHYRNKDGTFPAIGVDNNYFMQMFNDSYWGPKASIYTVGNRYKDRYEKEWVKLHLYFTK